MIHAISAAAIPHIADTEAAVRIQALANAYADVGDIVRYYTDDEGGYMAIYDGVAIVHAPIHTDEEWIAFLSFVPYVHSVRCDARLGRKIAAAWGSPCKEGELMRYNADCPAEQDTESDVKLDNVYTLLCKGFSDLPPFDVWYVDVSHRMRHGHCHVACVCHDKMPVSHALTVAETDSAVLLGAVVTDPAYRRQGLAARCVLSLTRAFFDRTVYIAPVDDVAADLYRRLGFCTCGSWAQVVR